MNSTDHDLIGQIYRSVTDISPFSRSLEKFANRYGAAAAQVLLNDHAEPVLSGVYLSPYHLSPNRVARTQEFIEKFAPREQAVIQNGLATRKRFQFVTDEEGYGMPSADIPANVWSSKYLGVERRCAARLSETPVFFDTMALNFPTGHSGFDPSWEGDLNIYLQHFATALEMLRPFRLLQARFNAIASVLDRMKVGIGVLTSRGELIHKNNRLDSILQQKDGLTADRFGILRTPSMDPTAQACFSSSLQEITADRFGNGGDHRFTFARPSGQISYVANLCALGPMLTDAPAAQGLAALIIKDPAHGDHVSVWTLKELCGLTSSEAEVCELLVNGASVGEIAVQRDVSEGSTRNQLASILQKTGTNSQSQLIRLALSADLPVENPEN